ncbi:MAG TPA: EamA family transporter [Devosia sp.]|nr:EamA family transporter [Devosia sp.]
MMPLRDILLALAIVVVWGVNFVAIRWGVDEIPPLLLTSLRYVVAAVPAVFFIRRPQVSLPILVGYGLAVGVGQFGLLFTAIKFGMPAGLSSLVIQLQAFFTIALAVLFLGERPRGAQLLGAFVALAGIALIAAERLGGAALWPFLMTIAAGACWGLANLLTKKAGRVDMLGFVVWSSLVPPIPLYLLSLLFEGPGAVGVALGQITWLGIGSLLFIGWVSTVFGYGAWSVLLGRYPASTVAPFTLLVPIVGILAAMLILGERTTGLELAGSAIVFAGLLLNVFGPRLFARSAAA